MSACCDVKASGQMLNFVTATKLYRKVPQDYQGQVATLPVIHPSQVFSKHHCVFVVTAADESSRSGCTSPQDNVTCSACVELIVQRCGQVWQ